MNSQVEQEREAIEDAIRKTEYKYFGWYELSDDQGQAVDLLVAVAQKYLAATASSSSVTPESGEQIDRKAAAGVYELLGLGPCQHIIDGFEDDTGVVQAFARHRLASLASQPPVLDEREVIERCAKVADDYFMAQFTEAMLTDSAQIKSVTAHRAKAAQEIAIALRNLGGADDVASAEGTAAEDRLYTAWLADSRAVNIDGNQLIRFQARLDKLSKITGEEV